MDYKYIVVCSNYLNGSRTRIAYGLAVVDCNEDDTIILKSYPDLSGDYAAVEKLAISCNEYELDIIHLDDIIEDFLE